MELEATSPLTTISIKLASRGSGQTDNDGSQRLLEHLSPRQVHSQWKTTVSNELFNALPPYSNSMDNHVTPIGMLIEKFKSYSTDSPLPG